MRTSLASGVALSVPTFFSGLIRAHGGGGGGGGETTTDPWGTTECTDQTTYETTWATTQETTLPETTVVTTAAVPKPKMFSFSLSVWVIRNDLNQFAISDEQADAHIFAQPPPPLVVPLPQIVLPPDSPIISTPYVPGDGDDEYELERYEEYTNTTAPLISGPTIIVNKVEPKGMSAGGGNWYHYFDCEVVWRWTYQTNEE